MKLLRTALLIGSSALAGAACTTTRAATPIERPALEVPPPPPRVIVPLPPPDQPYLEPVAELPTVTKWWILPSQRGGTAAPARAATDSAATK